MTIYVSAVTPVTTSTSPATCCSRSARHRPAVFNRSAFFWEQTLLLIPATSPRCSLLTHPAAHLCKPSVAWKVKAQGVVFPILLLWQPLDYLFSFSQVSAVGSLSPRRSLYRTLSDESVCSNRKGSSYASSHSSMLDQAMPNDILFSTTPPFHSTLPPRMIHNQGASNLRSKYSETHFRRAILKKTNFALSSLIKIHLRDRKAFKFLCMLLLDYHCPV